MNKLIRYWNQNRMKIIITVIIIVFIVILIQTINAILKNTRHEENENKEKIVDMSIPSESVISGEELPEETTQENVNIIKQFVDLCNKKDYETAYNLLTDDCKSQLYRTLDLFIENYGNKVFNTEKTYNLELWQYSVNTYTYKVNYIENNILATGEINSNNIQDYITIIEDINGSKLNINGFIEKRNINKSQEEKGIKITINDRFIYNEREKYSITIKNNTDKTILLSEGIDNNDICLIDNNEIEYKSILNEVSSIDLKINPNTEKTINISFYKIYNLYRTIESVCFRNIILDKDNYKNDENNSIIKNLIIEL